jgi:hypothetical protein
VDAIRAVCFATLHEEPPAMTFVVAGTPDPEWAVMIEAEAIIGQHRAPSA